MSGNNASGALDLTDPSKVLAYDPAEKKLVRVDKGKIDDYKTAGYVFGAVPGQDDRAAVEAEKLNSRAMQAAGAAFESGNAALFGLPSYILPASVQKTFARLREINPTTSSVAQFAGDVAGLGGAAKLLKGGLGAVSAGEAAAAAGEKLGGVFGAKWAAEGARSGADLIKYAPGIAAAAIQGGAKVASDHALSLDPNDELTIEKIGHGIGIGALLGAGGEGAQVWGGKLVTAAQRGIANKLVKMSKSPAFQAANDGLANPLGEVASASHGAPAGMEPPPLPLRDATADVTPLDPMFGTGAEADASFTPEVHDHYDKMIADAATPEERAAYRSMRDEAAGSYVDDAAPAEAPAPPGMPPRPEPTEAELKQLTREELAAAKYTTRMEEKAGNDALRADARAAKREAKEFAEPGYKGDDKGYSYNLNPGYTFADALKKAGPRTLGTAVASSVFPGLGPLAHVATGGAAGAYAAAPLAEYAANRLVQGMMNKGTLTRITADMLAAPAEAGLTSTLENLTKQSAVTLGNHAVAGDTEKVYQHVSNAALQAAANPEQVTKYLNDRYGSIFDGHPELYAKLVALKGRQIQYAADNVPKVSTPTSALQDDAPLPPRSQMVKYLEKVNAMNDPFTAMASPTVVSMQAVQDTNPALYSHLQRLLFARLSKPEIARVLTREQRRRASMVSGTNVSPMDDPAFKAGLQATASASSAAQGGPADSQNNSTPSLPKGGQNFVSSIATPAQQRAMDVAGP